MIGWIGKRVWLAGREAMHERDARETTACEHRGSGAGLGSLFDQKRSRGWMWGFESR